MNDLTASNYKFISNYYDKHLYRFDVLSVLMLLLYFPIGSLLVLLRISIILILNIIFHFKPNLKSNNHFIKLTCCFMGIHTIFKDDESKTDDESNLKILISNHISCLDLFSIKTLYNKCNAAYSHVHSNRNLDASLSNQTTSLSRYFENFFCNIFYDSNLMENENYSRNKSNYPLVYFPELMATNGKYGLLRFDIKPFDLEVSGSNLVYKPICLNVRRPFIPLSVNYMYSNNFTNIVFTLFSPVTLYEVYLLKTETKGENESSEQFSERIRNLISEKLKLNVLTEMNFTNFQIIWSNYQAERKQVAAASVSVSTRVRTSTSNSSNYSMGFDDISGIALHIKEILPDVSYEIIQSHIRSSSTLDIDTVIASILDSTHTSTIPSNNTAPTNVSTKKEFNKQNSFKNYEERKFDLINEARKRYLAKNTN